MTQKQIKNCIDKLENLYSQLPNDKKLSQIVLNIVQLEIILEQENNK